MQKTYQPHYEGERTVWVIAACLPECPEVGYDRVSLSTRRHCVQTTRQPHYEGERTVRVVAACLTECTKVRDARHLVDMQDDIDQSFYSLPLRANIISSNHLASIGYNLVFYW